MNTMSVKISAPPESYILGGAAPRTELQIELSDEHLQALSESERWLLAHFCSREACHLEVPGGLPHLPIDLSTPMLAVSTALRAIEEKKAAQARAEQSAQETLSFRTAMVEEIATSWGWPKSSFSTSNFISSIHSEVMRRLEVSLKEAGFYLTADAESSEPRRVAYLESMMRRDDVLRIVDKMGVQTAFKIVVSDVSRFQMGIQGTDPLIPLRKALGPGRTGVKIVVSTEPPMAPLQQTICCLFEAP